MNIISTKQELLNRIKHVLLRAAQTLQCMRWKLYSWKRRDGFVSTAKIALRVTVFCFNNKEWINNLND